MKRKYVIYADIGRWFLRKPFVLSIGAVIATSYLVLFRNVTMISQSDVIYDLIFCVDDPFFWLNFMIASTVYAMYFYKNRGGNFIYFCMTRCDKRSIILSRLMNGFLSSFLVMFLGVMLWLLSLRCFLPWSDYECVRTDQYLICCEMGLGELLVQKHFILYIVCVCFGLGLLSGIFSILSGLLSEFLQNEVLTVVASTMMMYIIDSLLADYSLKLYRYLPFHVLYFPLTTDVLAGKAVLRGIVYTVFFAGILGYIHYNVALHRMDQEMG